VTKVVTFGAFVEILSGVEGLVHISELAQHHVEYPREVVSQGQAVNVKIIEIDGERRRLSLSLKRVEETDSVQPRADGGPSVHLVPNLEMPDADVSVPEAFVEEYGPLVDAPAPDEPSAEAEVVASEAAVAVADEPVAEAVAEAVEPSADETATEPPAAE
jgi:small subunit ribosomal protein S1